ncbi:hypothetical protein PISMIDRAFT_85294, partial [Pisolithus microcarpus 441]
NLDNFADYETLRDSEQIPIQTANGASVMAGKETILVYLGLPAEHQSNLVHLYPVYYMPDLQGWPISLGVLLKNGAIVHGDSSHLTLYGPNGDAYFTCIPRYPRDTIFVLR